MTNSKNHKFIDIYKEFEDEVIFENDKNKESTLTSKATASGHITDYFDKYNIEEITYNTVEGYKSFRKSQIINKPKNKGKNINTISFGQIDKELVILRKFFNFCLKKNLVDINPVKTKNSFNRKKLGRHSISKSDAKFKIKKDIYDLFIIAVKKYEEKRNKKFNIADYINNRLNILLKNKEFLNSDLVKYKEDAEQIKIKIYNFIIADIDAYNLDRNSMLERVMEEEIISINEAYNKDAEKLKALIEKECNQILGFKKVIESFINAFNELNVLEKAIIIIKFIKSGIFNFYAKLDENLSGKRQEIFYNDSTSKEESIRKRIQRKKALKLQLFSYKTFHIKKDIYNKYLEFSEVIKKNGYKQDYNFDDLINFKLFKIMTTPMLFKKGRFEYDKLLYPHKYLRLDLTKSNKDIIVNLENRNKFKNVDWNKTMQTIIEYTIIIIGEELDDEDFKKYIPENMQ